MIYWSNWSQRPQAIASEFRAHMERVQAWERHAALATSKAERAVCLCYRDENLSNAIGWASR
jgi:hypothetical protein